MEICAIKGGGVGPLMANAILNFHFDYLTPSLRDIVSKRRRSIENEDFADMSGETPEPPKMDTFFIMDMMRSDL